MPGVCPRCLREVYFAEEKLALGKVWHTFCFSCRNCRKLLDSCTVATHCGELFCRNCCTRLFTPSVQPPSPPPTLDFTESHRDPPFPSAIRTPASASDSFSDCYCCCCCPEDCSIAAEVPSDTRESRLEKQRLRGGGGEEEEPEDFRLGEETQRCSESDCSNLGVVSSITTLCNAPSSPTAVTTWYNRQHSASQSTFGGQSCAKNRLVRPSSTPSPGNIATNFRSNNSDCTSNNTNSTNGGHKCSAVRRPGSSCRPGVQRQQQPQPLQQQQQQLEQLSEQQQPQSQHQQQQIQPQLQSQQLEPQKQPQQQQQILQPHHQILQREPHLQQLKQHIQNTNCNRNNNKNRYQPSLKFLRTSLSGRCITSPEPHLAIDKINSYETDRIGANINSLRGKPATPSPPPPFYHHQLPKRRVSFCSDVPEEESSCISESSCRMKMPNDNNGNCHGNGVTTAENNSNNYASSSQSCNGTPYETCYEMDDLNGAGYSNGGGNLGYGYSSRINEDGDPRPSSYDNEEETRLRGGCGGCGSGGGSRGGGCGCSSGGGCGGCATTSTIGPCPPRDQCCEQPTPCGTPSCDPPCGGRGGCCAPAGCRPVCRKPGRSCCPPCVAEPQGCGGGGCCGGGCRGGCGKPGRLCMPLRPCSSPPCQPQVCRPRGSPCQPPRCCAPTPPCCKPPGITSRPSCSIGGGGSCCRSKSPRRGCCSSPQDDGGCGYCGPKLPPGCECLGGGLDCQRCGRKVYQAEMQIASGVPYHNICFSCFCCRKPLEPLTYQENCGEIYCKQCYVRNFGPQGYGYGAGAGVLQTPM